MKKEDVLELKIIDTLITEDGIDYIICKLSQNTEVLKRGANTECSKSFEYPVFAPLFKTSVFCDSLHII